MFENSLDYLYVLLPLIVAIVILLVFGPRYIVVPAHEAHIVIKRSGRHVYTSREAMKATYWFIPILHQRSILPLENIKLEIPDISLRDKKMAKFLGDVRCWLNIENPQLAAEKLGLVESAETARGFPAIEKDVKDLVEAVTRNSSMRMEVFEIMSNREKFSQEVEEQVQPILKQEWGIKIADLEVIHFIDVEGYTVIKDLERRQAKVIETETRKLVAMNERDAAISEAEANKDKETRKAEAEETFRKRQIEKDETIGRREQEKLTNIAHAEINANEQRVAARQKLEVGNAEVEKQAAIKKAEAEAEKRKRQADGESEYTKRVGYAEADVSKTKLLAEAEGTQKKAIALKNYNEAGLSLELIKANVDIQRAKFSALGEGLKVAKINMVTSGESNLFGIPVGAETGADLGAMLVALQNQGINITELLKSLPLSETAKMAIAAKAGISVVKEATKK